MLFKSQYSASSSFIFFNARLEYDKFSFLLMNGGLAGPELLLVLAFVLVLAPLLLVVELEEMADDDEDEVG